MRAEPRNRSTRALVASLAAATLLFGAAPASAAPEWLKFPEMPDWEWEDSRAMKATATVLDAFVVRPVAAVRVLVGGALFLPAAMLSVPMGREGLETAYETLITEPTEYAFKRPMGEL